MACKIMGMRSILIPFALAAASSGAAAQTLDSFGVLAGSTVTNTGPSVINGNVGVSAGTAIVGFDPPPAPPEGIIVAPYSLHANDGAAILAQSELEIAIGNYGNRPATAILTGTDLGGQTLTAGVYSFSSSAQLTGQLVLDAQGNPNAQFIFDIDSTLTTASSSSVLLVNGAQGGNVFFVVGSSATLGTGTAFAGRILARESITLTTNASIICGAALARTGAVTLDTNDISICVLDVADVAEVLEDLPITSDNVGAIDDVLDSLPDDTLPPEFDDLIAFLSPAELAEALSQLSGEVGTAVAPAGQQATRAFLSQISDRLRAGPGAPDASAPAESGSPAGQVPPADNTVPNTVMVLGYGPEERSAASGSFGYIDEPGTRLDPRQWTAWAGAYGGRSETDGDNALGSHERTISTSGFAAGLDYRATPQTLVGIAFSAGGADFSLADGYGDGDSDILQAAIYGRADFGAAYVSGAVAYAWNDVYTERTQTMGGSDRFTADFSAHDLAGQVEAGYRFLLPEFAGLPGSAGITPYAALQVHSFHTPSYSETAASGSDAFALNYDAHTSNATYTELGVRTDRSFRLESNSVVTLRAGIAWAHVNASDEIVNVAFQSLPDSGFTTQGAELAEDSVLLSAGAEIKLVGGFGLAATFDTALAASAQTYAGRAQISYSW